MKLLLQILFAPLFGIFALMMSLIARADPPVFTSLTAAVDFSTAMAAILVVMAALAGVAILWKGGKLILRAIGF